MFAVLIQSEMKISIMLNLLQSLSKVKYITKAWLQGVFYRSQNKYAIFSIHCFEDHLHFSTKTFYSFNKRSPNFSNVQYCLNTNNFALKECQIKIKERFLMFLHGALDMRELILNAGLLGVLFWLKLDTKDLTDHVSTPS